MVMEGCMPQSLADQISSLLELQKIDTQIYALETKLKVFPVDKQKIQASLDARKKDIDSTENVLKKLQLQQKELENDIQTKDNQISKYQLQQNQVKTNQEYTALTHEMEAARADKSILEEEALLSMQKVEDQKKVIATHKANFDEEQKKTQIRLQEMQAKEKDLESQIQVLKEERKKFAPSVDKELFMQYHTILQKREGIALVPLQGHSCGGCDLYLPPQTVNRIKLKEELIFCESCSRIIYDSE